MGRHFLLVELNKQNLFYRYQRGKRTIQKRPGRTDQWWRNLIEGKMDDNAWKENFRMTKENFYKLVALIRPFAKERSDRVRKDIIPLDKRLGITLYYLKDQGSMNMTSNPFGVARCSVGQIVFEICSILANDLGPSLIKFPVEKNEVENVSEHFLKRFGFPNVIGCVDGTHIPIKQPNENPHDYFSYKLCYSINCQAICDAYGKFTNVEVKWPGSVHDARVFANSSVQKNFTDKKFPMFYKELLPGEQPVSQLLLGDPAYPLLPHVMKEYDTCNSNEQVIFNQMLRSARNQIECAFGRLKARWRILTRPMDIPTERLPIIIFACFVLHNYCEEQKERVKDTIFVEHVMMEERKNQCPLDRIFSYGTSAGTEIRRIIAEYFKEYL